MAAGIAAAITIYSRPAEKMVTRTSIFSWSDDLLSDKEKRASLDHAAEQLSIGRVFQAFPKEPDQKETEKFVKHLNRDGRLCYGLLGKPQWAQDRGLAEAEGRMEALAAYNEQAADGEKLAGVVLDIEPYLLEQWGQDRQTVMAAFLENMKALYQYAQEKELYTIICVPYWFDNDYSGILESLIQDACDELAVMNYYVGEEYSHIETELGMCKKAGKPIISITEFQSPGYHDLTDEITYYNRGLSAAQDMFEQMKEQIRYKDLSFSYHCLEPVLELLEDTQGDSKK
ncbi:hypothetical protein NE619_11070 [Anaerovorax odorimutans]|uniref:Uncharacterized protein n=2 Tax=Anaerovorax odorimutans TaxID=109327 RepID=A0ABT1RPY1_9FIRM|nr:hypothetical protein [Anaerovorax odorimutans]